MTGPDPEVLALVSQICAACSDMPKVRSDLFQDFGGRDSERQAGLINAAFELAIAQGRLKCVHLPVGPGLVTRYPGVDINAVHRRHHSTKPGKEAADVAL